MIEQYNATETMVNPYKSNVYITWFSHIFGLWQSLTCNICSTYNTIEESPSFSAPGRVVQSECPRFGSKALGAVACTLGGHQWMAPWDMSNMAEWPWESMGELWIYPYHPIPQNDPRWFEKGKVWQHDEPWGCWWSWNRFMNMNEYVDFQDIFLWISWRSARL